MQTIRVQRLDKNSATVEQLKATREWMDNTAERHAYMCFPLSLTNRLGWGISFSGDIRAVWDGVEDYSADHVKILEGSEFAYPDRGHGTLSFITRLLIRTDENVSILTMPVPNLFIPGIQTFTTLLSTSFYEGHFPLAMKFTEPNREIFIPAGTPVATILPISISNLQNNFQMEIVDEPPTPEYIERQSKYGEFAEQKNKNADWSNLYRDAVDYDGTPMGKHESKSIKLKTVTCPITGATSSEPDN